MVAGRGARVFYAQGFHLADVEARTPFTPETPIPVGAAGQTVIAAAVWLLAEQGRLDLDAPVQHYLPRFPWPEPTLRHLLTHSAGLPGPEHRGHPKEKRGGAVERLSRAGLEPARPPGTLYAESPIGYDVLAEVIEAVERRPFESFVQEHLLDRLDIRLTRDGDGDPPPALSYHREEGWLKPDSVPDSPGFTGESGLSLSALDLYRWCVSFYLDPVLREETLKRGGRRASLEGGPVAVDQLGWTYAEGGRRYRAANLGGHTVFAYRDVSRRFGVVFVSNTAMPLGVRPRLARALVRILEGGAARRIDVPPASPLPADDLAPVTGSYKLPVLGRLELTHEEDGVVVRLGEGPRYRARRAGETHLHVPGLDAWLAFEGSGADGFQGLRLDSIFHAARGERVSAPEPTAKEVQP